MEFFAFRPGLLPVFPVLLRVGTALCLGAILSKGLGYLLTPRFRGIWLRPGALFGRWMNGLCLSYSAAG